MHRAQWNVKNLGKQKNLFYLDFVLKKFHCGVAANGSEINIITSLCTFMRRNAVVDCPPLERCQSSAVS